MSKIKSINKNQGGKIRISQKETISIDEQTFTFSLEYVQKDYCFENLNKDEKLSVINSLFKRRDLTWREIRQSPRHGLGIEEIKRGSIRRGIPQVKFLSEDTVIHAMRFCGKKPMVGFRYERVFYILWFDRDFSLYEH